MAPEQWAQAMAASVAPVVIISASALLCLALYNRLAAIISRMRAVQRERLEVQEHFEALSRKEIDHGAGPRLTCILESLADQSNSIRLRARLIRNSLTCLLGAIGALVICSLFNGVTVFFPILAPASAGMFILGLLMMLCGVVYAARELNSSLVSAEFETDLVSELTGTGSNDAPAAGESPRLVLRKNTETEAKSAGA